MSKLFQRNAKRQKFQKFLQNITTTVSMFHIHILKYRGVLSEEGILVFISFLRVFNSNYGCIMSIIVVYLPKDLYVYNNKQGWSAANLLSPRQIYIRAIICVA